MRVDIVKKACPVPLTGTLASMVEPSLKDTLPDMTVPPGEVTAALKVTDCPYCDEAGAVSVVVLDVITNCATTFLGAFITNVCGFVVPWRSPVKLVNV